MITQTLQKWNKVKLGDVAEIESGGTPSSTKPEYWDGGDIRWATLPDLKNKYLFDTQRKITPLGLKNSSAKLLPINSVVFSSRATIGEISIAKIETSTNQGSKNFICDPTKIDYEFLYYLLKSKVEEINNLASGATYKEINKTVFSGIEVEIPNIPIQKQIAQILAVYDDLIYNHTRRIQILEQIAQTTYTAWFVNFRFPGHEKVKMIDSGTDFGKIPEGWSVKKLCDVVYNFDSKRCPISKMKRAHVQGEVPYYGAAKIIDYINEVLLDGKYLLFAEDGSVITKEGYPVLQFVDEKFWVSNHAHVLQGKEISTEHLYIALSKFSIRGYITGAAQPKITQENMNRIPILIPDVDTQAQFNNQIEPLFELQFKLRNSLTNLSKTRDLLLPKLVTGEMEVKI